MDWDALRDEFTITRNYKGISERSETRKGYRHSRVVIVYCDGGVEIYYGDDPKLMRESIDKLYETEYEQKPTKFVCAARLL